MYPIYLKKRQIDPCSIAERLYIYSTSALPVQLWIIYPDVTPGFTYITMYRSYRSEIRNPYDTHISSLRRLICLEKGYDYKI